MLSEITKSYKYAVFTYTNLSAKGPGDNLEIYRKELDSLQTVVDSLESELAEKSASFRKRLEERKIDASRILACMPENSVIIDFMRYRYIPVDNTEATDHYMAMALKPEKDPVVIDLGLANSIDSAIEEYRLHMQVLSGQDHFPTKTDAETYRKISNAIYSMVLQPFMDDINDAGLVFISPDGALNLVSFAGLTDDEGKYLVERFPIHYLSSSRDLVRIYSDTNANGHGLLALGNPDFDADPDDRLNSRIPIPADTNSSDNQYVTRSLRSGYGNFQELKASPLPGSARELEMISEAWKGSNIDSAIVLQGATACEDNLKRFAPGRQVIHLATHGYYFKGIKYEPKLFASIYESDFTPYQNPLLLSGLLLSGANLHGEGVDSDGVEDGILSAYEVSVLDLTGVDLVVLSGCETGLGRIETGEGVYGLRRAFLLAGAKSVVSSLWEVPDNETAQLLGRIYDFSDKPVYQRIRGSQLKMIKKLRSKGLSDHPFNWAGFIAIGDWK